MSSLPATERKISIELLAIFLVIFSSGIFSTLHGFVRTLALTLPPLQIAFISVSFAPLMFAPWLARRGLRVLATRRFGTHFLRAGFNAGAILSWFTAITMVPLADATAVNMVTPIFVIIGAALFLGERIRFWRWGAVVVGLAGALVIIRPGFQSLEFGFILVLVSALSTAISQLIGKSLASTDEAALAVFYLTSLMVPFMLVPALMVWQWPTANEWLLLAGVGMAISSAHFILFTCFKMADVSALQPFTFTRLLWAALVGFIGFGEIPGIWVWVGGGMIFCAVTFAARREALGAKAAKI